MGSDDQPLLTWTKLMRLESSKKKKGFDNPFVADIAGRAILNHRIAVVISILTLETSHRGPWQ
jgi:hypothetical protein